MNKVFFSLATVLCVCTVLVTAYTQQQTPQAARAQPLTRDPIVAIGHGSFVGVDGKEIVPTADFIEMVQEFYINNLLKENGIKEDRKKYSDAVVQGARKTISGEVDDKILANALFLDWLLERVAIGEEARVINANNALRWHYVHKIQKNAVLPKENVWGKGLKPETAKRLEEKIGTKILALTNAGGEQYCAECLEAGVPIPDFMFGSEWRFVGEVENEFLSEGSRAELWIHESQSPPGICLALPRFPSGSDRAELFGVICLGTQSSKACFFDNPRGKFFQRNVPIDFKKEFVGGVDLVANAQGVCTDCHAGENPYVVHPEKPAFASVLGQLQPMAWHDPLVAASWPQNPGPTVQLDAVASPVDAIPAIESVPPDVSPKSPTSFRGIATSYWGQRPARQRREQCLFR